MSHADGLFTQGENIRFSFQGGDGTFEIDIYDASGNPRFLQTYERLIVDSLNCDTGGGGRCQVTWSATLDEQHLIAQFDDASQNIGVAGPVTYPIPKLGIDIPKGQNLFLTTGGSSVSLQGSGRIITAGTQGSRPSWRERLASHAL